MDSQKVYSFDTVQQKLVQPDYSITVPDGTPALPLDCITLNNIVGHHMESLERRLLDAEKNDIIQNNSSLSVLRDKGLPVSTRLGLLFYELSWKFDNAVKEFFSILKGE